MHPVSPLVQLLALAPGAAQPQPEAAMHQDRLSEPAPVQSAARSALQSAVQERPALPLNVAAAMWVASPANGRTGTLRKVALVGASLPQEEPGLTLAQWLVLSRAQPLVFPVQQRVAALPVLVLVPMLVLAPECRRTSTCHPAAE